MASNKGYAILNVQNDDDELQFQDFGVSGSTSTQSFGNYPDSPGHQGDSDKLLGEYPDDDETTPKSDKNLSFWSFEFYKELFDVDSKQVGDRIMWSMVPKPGLNFLQVHLRPKPDLYGPFWICLTLVFAAAISGNISNYLQTHGEQKPVWRYDFHKVSLASAMVFSYGWLLPLILWCVVRYRSPTPPVSLMEFICLYGYSLSVLVPVCIIWTVPMAWLRWCVGIVGVVLSGVVLSKSIWEGMKGKESLVIEEEDDNQSSGSGMKKIAMVMMVVVVVMHIAIAMGFMFYFFSEPYQHGGSHAFQPATPTISPPKGLNDSAIINTVQNKEVVSATKRDVLVGTNNIVNNNAIPDQRIVNRSLDTPINSKNEDKNPPVVKNSAGSTDTRVVNSSKVTNGSPDTKVNSNKVAGSSTDTKAGGSTAEKPVKIDSVIDSNNNSNKTVEVSNTAAPNITNDFKIKIVPETAKEN